MVISDGNEGAINIRCINSLEGIELSAVMFEHLCWRIVNCYNQEQMIWGYRYIPDSFSRDKGQCLVYCV